MVSCKCRVCENPMSENLDTGHRDSQICKLVERFHSEENSLMKKASTFLRAVSYVFFLLLITIVFIIAVQVAHRSSIHGQAYAVLGFVYLFPWGILTVQSMLIGKFRIGLALRTFFAALVAWTSDLLIVYTSVIFLPKNLAKPDSSLISLLTDAGLIFSCVTFGLIQLYGWVPGITKKIESGYVIAVISVVAGTFSVFVITALSIPSDYTSQLNRSWIAIFGVLMGPTVLSVTGALAYLLQKKTPLLGARI